MVSLPAAMLALALAGADPVLLDFYADWCGPCRQMAPVIHELEAAGYKIRKVNIDQQRELASRFSISEIPSFVLLVDGKEVSRVSGAQSRQELQTMFAAAKRRTGVIARAQSPDDAAPGAFPAIASDPLGSPPPLDVPPRHDVAPAVADHVEPVREPIREPVRVESDAVLRRLMAASVRIKIDDGGSNSVGSGTIIDAREGEALVLTCGHIFRDSKGQGPVTIDLFGPGAPQDLPGHVLSYDLESDVGLVSFRPSVPVAAARVASANRVTQKSAVVNIGCNHGREPTARVSHITAINKFLGPPTFSVAGQPDQGRSGGGLFTVDGYLIGVCNAADPADNEGLYAGIDPIHKELARKGLKEMCLEPVDPSSGNVLTAVAVEPPVMASQMPAPGPDRVSSGLKNTTDGLASPSGLTPQEAATLAEIGRRGDGAEVICIVRSLSDPRAKSEIIVLDRASPEFVKQLASEQKVQDMRHLTVHKRSARQKSAPSAALPANQRAAQKAAARQQRPAPFKGASR